MNLEGRNEIRYNNSGGRCLLENWVEERATQNLEATDINRDDLNCAKTHQYGHKGLLTLSFDAKAEKNTTVRSSYKPPAFPRVATQGLRYRQELNQVVNQVRDKLIQEAQPTPSPMEAKSVKQLDFDNNDFQFVPPAANYQHDLYLEPQTSFWTDNKARISGVSQCSVSNAPFRKNTAFSKPYNEYHGESLPHGINNH